MLGSEIGALRMRRKCSTTELHCQHHTFQEQTGKSGLSGLKGNSSVCELVSMCTCMYVCVLSACVCAIPEYNKLIFITCVHVREYMCECL